MAALEVDASEYKEIAARLKAAEKSVARSLRKRLREAGKPLAEGVVADGAEGMPSRGGLASWLRESKGALSMTSTRLAIRLSRGRHDLNSLNRGRLRHPVFGNRRVWVSQDVPAGTWDRAFEKHAEEAAPVMERVLDDIARELT